MTTTEKGRRRKRSTAYGKKGISHRSVILGLVLIANLVSVWCFGGVHESVYAVAGIIGFVCIGLLAISNWRQPNHGSLWSSLTPWVLLLPFVLGAIQLVPVNSNQSVLLSPQGTRIREALSLDNELDQVANTTVQPDATAKPSNQRFALSLVPSETRLQLAKYWVVCAFLLATMFSITSAGLRQTFLVVIVGNGVLISVFALFQKLLWNGKLFWSVSTPWPFVLGPFVNKNNGSGYLLLTLAAAMSLLALRANYGRNELQTKADGHGRARGRGRYETGGRARESRMRSDRVRARSRGRLRLNFFQVLNDTPQVMTYLAVSFLWLAILLSMSRGGFVGAVVATIFTAASVWRRHWLRVVLVLGFCTAFATALVSWSKQTDQVQDRIATITNAATYEEARFLHWGDDLKLAADFLTTGVGLGSYQYANQPYRSFFLPAWFRYSENQYLESLIVGGVMGLSLLLVFVFMVWRAIWQLSKQRGRYSKQIVTLGCFAIVSQMISGFFDFGLYHASSGILMACIVGLIFGGSEQHANPNRSWAKWNYRAWLIVTLVIGVFCCRELLLRANVERAMNWSSRKIELANAEPDALEPRLTREISQMKRALEICPDHALGQARLASLHILKFRKAVFDDLVTFSNGQISEESLWDYTDLYVVSSRFRQVRQDEGIRELAESVAHRKHLVPAWNALLASREACSMVPKVHYRLALLQPLIKPSPARSAIHLKRVAFLAPQDSDLLFNCGMVICQLGNREVGLKWIRKAAQLEYRIPEHVATFAKTYLSPSEFVTLILPPEPSVILYVINRYFTDEEEYADWRVALGTQAAELLRPKVGETASSHDNFQLGQASFFSGQAQIACDFYKKAIKDQPGVASWRFAYAKSLAATGDHSTALREAKLSLRLNPNLWRAKHLIRELETELRKQSRR